jgi:hypothetical protein
MKPRSDDTVSLDLKTITREDVRRVRDRNLTPEEVRIALECIRDLAISWMWDCVESREPKGCGGAKMILSAAGDELERLPKLAGGPTATVKLIVEGYDPSRLAFGSNGPTADA